MNKRQGLFFGTLLFIILFGVVMAIQDYIPQGNLDGANTFSLKRFLNISGRDLYISNNANISGSLNVEGNTNFTGSLSIGGNISTQGNLSASYLMGDGSLLTGLSGGGDINGVNVIGYIIGGGDSGTVIIGFNETLLNTTIDDRSGEAGTYNSTYALYAYNETTYLITTYGDYWYNMTNEIDPFSIHVDGSTQLTANLDVGDFNITADWFKGKVNITDLQNFVYNYNQTLAVDIGFLQNLLNSTGIYSTYNSTYHTYAYNSSTVDQPYADTQVAKDDLHTHSLLNITGIDTNVCSGTDKVVNVTFDNGDLIITCDTDSSDTSTYNITYDALIPYGYNQTEGANTYTDGEISNINTTVNIQNLVNSTGIYETYNETYDSFAYNQSDGSYNSTYDGIVEYGYNQTAPAITYTDTEILNLNTSDIYSTYNGTYDNYAHNQSDGSYNISYDEFISANRSNYWDNYDTANSTQIEENGGVLSIIQSWLTTFINSWWSGIDLTDSHTLDVDNISNFDYNYNQSDGSYNSTYADYAYNETSWLLDTYGDNWLNHTSVVDTLYGDDYKSTYNSTYDGKLDDVVEDTSPQLGGYLDTNGEDIGSTLDEIENIYVGTNTRIYFGDGQEANVYYNGSNLVISG